MSYCSLQNSSVHTSVLRTNVTAPFEINSLQWRMQRESRSLRLFAVEPHFYEPSRHTSIFFGAINRLKAGTTEAYDLTSAPMPVTPFDLAVFPEVFLPADGLVLLVRSLASAGPTGCIHTGIRPDTESQFLFTRDQALTLIKNLIEAGACANDTQRFEAWLQKQTPSSNFNLGAVIAVDAENKVRVAIHPKVLRSKFELSVLAESNMTEAKFLTLIELIPTGSTLLPIVLQPLLCSDALIHDTDLPGARPLEAISRFGNSFGERIPDQVDIVSLATCSPHPNAMQKAIWHNDFREGFLRMAKDDECLRHRHAVLVVANFVQIPGKSRTGGLSGAYLPVPLHFQDQPEYVVAAQYATAKSQIDPAWHIDNVHLEKKSAHMVCLKPPTIKINIEATMLGFDLHRMLKETNQYNPPHGLLRYEHLTGHIQSDGSLIFS